MLAGAAVGSPLPGDALLGCWELQRRVLGSDLLSDRGACCSPPASDMPLSRCLREGKCLSLGVCYLKEPPGREAWLGDLIPTPLTSLL